MPEELKEDFRSVKAKFYRSADWKTARNNYVKQRFDEDKGKCEYCRQVEGEEVHHIIPLSPKNINDKNITVNFENLKYLCRECHSRNEQVRADKYKNPPFKIHNGTYFDENGKLCQQKVTVVWGCSFAGKSSYVREHMSVGDFIVDTTQLFKAFSYQPQEDFPEALLGNILDIRASIYKIISDGKINARQVWVIEQAPTVKQRKKLRHALPTAEFVFIDKTKDECIERLEKSKIIIKKYKIADVIGLWFEKFEKD
ncbi:hypothetical protein FACS1894132_09790 [Clostridia bacterium]|nr:hypothetical protein FACS1894132_09790 [Clostridia bacterium]